MPSSPSQASAQKRSKRAADPTYNDRERERRKYQRGAARQSLPTVNPIPAGRVVELLGICKERLSNSFMSQKTCCVCDCLYPTRDLESKRVERCKVLVRAMQSRLKPPRGLPPELESHYDASDINPIFAGMLLSRRGLFQSASSTMMLLCGSCFGSLSKSRVKNAPKFAIANGLFIGELPDAYDDTTMTENAMVNLAQPTRYLSVVQGGKHSSIRSHAYYFRADPTPPAVLLPAEVVSNGTIGVTMIGAMTPLQKATTLRRYCARVSRLFALLGWYMNNNRLYDHIGVTDRSQIEAFVSSTNVVLDCSRESRPNRTDGEQTVPVTPRQHIATVAIADPSARVDSDATSSCPCFAQLLDDAHSCHNQPRPAHLAAPTLEAECMEQSAVALVTNFAMEDDVQLVRRVLDNASADIIVQRSSGILSDFDAEFWSHSFCELFPFGRGGLDEERSTKIGLETYLRHCLRLSSRRFARHPSFALVAFDVIARHRATQAVYLRAKLFPGIMRSIARVDREQLLHHVNYLEDRRRAITANSRLPEPPVVDQPVLDLLSAVATGLRAFLGSNQERGQARTQVMSMQLVFGQPAIFFTISPDCSASYRVANLAGEMSDDLLDSARVTLSQCVAYSKAKLGSIATRNPTACAQYYNYLLNLLIEVVLNWDTSRKCSKPGVGIFGETEAFYVATESQGSTGNLHGHMLVWVRGMAKTVDDYYSQCKNSAVQQRLQAYVASIASSSFPISGAVCPTCGAADLESQPFEAEAFQKPKKSRERPVTSKYAPCLSGFGADEIIQLRMGSAAAALDETWPAAATHHLLASPAPPPLPARGDVQADLVVSRALTDYQVHHWYHSRSCFKASRRTPAGKICRMFFPKEAVADTRWTVHDKVELRREIGSEYLNTDVPLVNSVFKCNHDVKFLAAAEGPEKAFYMMKYTTKDQNTIENPLTIHVHAYDKAQIRAAGSDDAVAAGRRCVQSMCCSMSNAQEIAAPLASLYLQRESPFYSSVDFQNIHISSCAKAIFENAAIDVTLTQGAGSSYVPSGPFLDYLHRPAELETQTLMSFVRLYQKLVHLRGLRFRPPHAQRTTHSVHLREVPAVPCLLGKRLPDMRNSDVDGEQRQDFQRAILTLFRPFRRLEDLCLGDTATSEEQFRTWWHRDAPPDAHLFLRYSNDYYSSRELARKRLDADTERYRSYFDGVFDDNYVSDSDSNPADDSQELIDGDEMWSDTATITSPTTYTHSINKAFEAATLAASTQRVPLPADCALYSSLTVDSVDRDIAKAEEAFLARENQALSLVSCQVDVALPTRVRLLTSALENAASWTDPALLEPTTGSAVPANASLADISQRFGLNRKQHKAFIRVGAGFLHSILMEPHLVPDQIIAFLGGGPGTGKSQVIRALQGLAASWGSSDAVKTVAYQGVAAEAANGQTIHSLFKWRVGQGAHAKRYSLDDKEKFASLKLLVMDEVSTTDAKFIGMIDIALRDLKNEPAKRFGGIHILFVGDWLQQLPVAGHPAFVDQAPPPISRSLAASRRADDTTSTYLLRQRGIDAYRELNEVVMLEVNMRHRDDPVWRDILARWRNGDYIQADIDLVNRRCYTCNWRSASATAANTFCPILVTSNALRVEFNQLATQAFCKASRQVLHYFPTAVSRPRGELSPGQRRSLKDIRSDKTSGIPMVLMIAIGLPMQCTKNISRALHLANGTIGTVAGFRAASGDTVRVDDSGDYASHFHSVPPETVFVHLFERALLGSTIVACAPAGVTPVRCRKEKSVSVSIRNRSFTVSVDQVPLVPAFGLTTEKCQGLTVEKAIIGPLRHSTRMQPQRSSFYVAVTRVKSMQYMFLLEPLTLEFLQYFTPSRAALDETLRLQRLECVCDRRHEVASA